MILPARNAVDTVDHQLAALSRQTFAGRWELIVADNGSRDATVDRVHSWAARIPQLRILDAVSAPGAYGARNQANRLSRGPLLAYCDADDVVAPGWLEAIVDGLGRNGLVTGPIDLMALNSDDLVAWRTQQVWGRLPAWHNFLPGALTSNLGMRRVVFEAIGGFEPRRSGSDLRFVWRAQLAGWKLGQVPGAVVHRREPQSGWHLIRRNLRYGLGEARLYSEFRAHGMPRSSFRQAGVRWLAIIFCWPTLALARWRYAWLTVAGQRVGRMAGSILVRTLYP